LAEVHLANDQSSGSGERVGGAKRDRRRVKIAITGANSGVGRTLVRHLAARDDIQAVACVRSPRAAAALPASPRVSVHAIDYGDRERLAAALTGSSCIVHLAGILFESSTSTYQSANVEATQAVVDACRKAGVARVVLVSVLGADPESTNQFWRSKGRAERIIAESGLSAAIIRTPILLGPDMAGARAIVHQAAGPTVTLLGGGRHSIRPLDVDDLSRAILQCCESSPAGARVYELVGPETTSYRGAIARTAALMGREVSVRSMPVWLARLGAAIAGWTRHGGMTPAVIEVITSDEAVNENADVELGVTLTPLSATLQKLLASEPEVAHP
jgi:NADH dehydrogenase